MTRLDRRLLLKGSAALAGTFTLGGGLAATRSLAQSAPLQLKATPAKAQIGPDGGMSDVFTYTADGIAEDAPAIIRMKRGKPFAARLINGLSEPTTVHWHGLRIPNAMDGVPELTQPYVYPGDGFDYTFTPPDAGTFWYHPHCNTLSQMGHGLAGMIIVEDPSETVFDAELPLLLRDWRLGKDGAFLPDFKPRDAAKGGTYGTVRTANWKREPVYPLPAGGLVRLRIATVDVTRLYTLGIEGAEAVIVALDSNPLPAPLPLDRLDLGPGQRVDLVVRMPDSEWATVALKNLRGSSPFTVASFPATGASLKRSLSDVPTLAQNPIAEPDLSTATRIPLLLSATAEHAAAPSICGSLGYTFWAINRIPWPGDTPDPVAPTAEMKLGKSYILEITNRTPHAHPIHLHGMSFHVLSASKHERLPPPTDTILLQPDEQAELALVADNPGDWVFHCHIIEHQKTGMTGYFRVT